MYIWYGTAFKAFLKTCATKIWMDKWKWKQFVQLSVGILWCYDEDSYKLSKIKSTYFHPEICQHNFYHSRFTFNNILNSRLWHRIAYLWKDLSWKQNSQLHATVAVFSVHVFKKNEQLTLSAPTINDQHLISQIVLYVKSWEWKKLSLRAKCLDL